MIAHSALDKHRTVCGDVCWCPCLTCFAHRTMPIRLYAEGPPKQSLRGYTYEAQPPVIQNFSVLQIAVGVASLPEAERGHAVELLQAAWDRGDEVIWQHIHNGREMSEDDWRFPEIPLSKVIEAGTTLDPEVLQMVEPLSMGHLPGDGLAFRDVATGVYDRCHPITGGDVVLDVGAHVGAFTTYAAERLGKDGRVFAFEPEPRNFACLSLRTTSLAMVKARPLAIGEGAGATALHFHTQCTAGHSRCFSHANAARLLVPMATIDTLCTSLDRLDLVKIDAEGSEVSIIRGGRATLERLRPHLVIEVDGTGEALGHVLAALQYTIMALEKLPEKEPRPYRPTFGIWYARPEK